MQINFFEYAEKVNEVQKFGICDDAGAEQKAYVDYETENERKWGALVKSEKSKDYSFIPVDNNIKISKPDNPTKEESRCDAMLYTKKSIAFIELKDTRKSKANIAAKQIKSTIKEFKKNHNIEEFDNKYAYVCNKSKPNFNSTSNSLCAEFTKETGIPLHISRTIKKMD